MKVLHVSTSDIHGGAFGAAYRLHQGMQQIGLDSKMLVQLKRSDDYTVFGPSLIKQRLFSDLRPMLDYVPAVFYPRRRRIIFSPALLPSGIVRKINKLNPEVVNLHWITGGFVRLEELAKIKKPLVWTIHDMWSFTGGCHYSGDCLKYQVSCGHCSDFLRSSMNYDLSRFIYNRKKRTYAKIDNLTIVSPSHWLKKTAQTSSLFKNQKIEVIPNAINTEVYRPIPQAEARRILNLPQDQKLILFGAVNATVDKRKGHDYLKKALAKLSIPATQLLIFGASQPAQPEKLKFPTRYLGRLYDDTTLALLYSAADVMVAPSLQENLACSIMEALACGTPVVAFNIGGNADMIEHQKNGYLAQPLDVNDLAKGIDWILAAANRRSELSRQARQKVLTEFSAEKVAAKYKQLYASIINR